MLSRITYGNRRPRICQRFPLSPSPARQTCSPGQFRGTASKHASSTLPIPDASSSSAPSVEENTLGFVRRIDSDHSRRYKTNSSATCLTPTAVPTHTQGATPPDNISWRSILERQDIGRETIESHSGPIAVYKPLAGPRTTERRWTPGTPVVAHQVSSDDLSGLPSDGQTNRNSKPAHLSSKTGGKDNEVLQKSKHEKTKSKADAIARWLARNDRRRTASKLVKTSGASSAEYRRGIIFKGLQVKPTPKVKRLRQIFRSRFDDAARAAKSDAEMPRTSPIIELPRIPAFSDIVFKRMRSSPSSIIRAIRRGRLTPRARTFNYAAWSQESSATAKLMKHMLAMDSTEIVKLRTQAREVSAASENEMAVPTLEFKRRFLARLQKTEYSSDDIQEWTRIALAPDNCRASLYLRSSCAVPPSAIFNEVMRDTTIDFRTLRRLATSCKLALIVFNERTSPTEAGNIQDSQFITMFSLLLDQARRVGAQLLPQAIAPLVVQYCKIISRQDTSKARLSQRLHKICNTAVVKLAMTTDRHPMENMYYQWLAQAKVLEHGDSFLPSLELEPATYRAIIKVLLASKKTAWEIHAVSNLHRTWPPWRKTQDGMDARIQPDDELTRVVSVVQNLIRSGYKPSSFDRMAMILGGRDLDGTPTIPIRTLLKSKYKKDVYDSTNTDTALEWAARVRATRDIKEAWGVFRASARRGLKPTQGMFDEMIEKLLSDAKRVSGARNDPHIPGAGKEVATYHNYNLSETEIQRVTPPGKAELLALMKKNDVKLSTRSLCLLIETAQSPRHARDLMRWNGENEVAVQQLAAGRHLGNSDRSQAIILKEISQPSMTAYIKLLCRYSAYNNLVPNMHGGRSSGYEYLLDAIYFLRHNPGLRQAWYALVNSVALVKVARDGQTYDFENSDKLWTVLLDALQYLRHSMSLDGDYFGYACFGLYNALVAERHGYPMRPQGRAEGIQFVNDLWSDLTVESTEKLQDEPSPALPSEIKGWHLHAYVRLLANTKQKEGIASLLAWMARHETEIDTIALNRESGLIHLRRTLVAMRVYALSTKDEEYEDSLRQIAEGISQDWGGWPIDTEVDEYVNHTSDAEATRDIHPEMRLGHGIIQKGSESMFSSAESNDEQSVGLDGTVPYRPM